MSIERIDRKRGAGWRVRWREAGRNRARMFDRKADAVAFEAETRRRARTGDLVALDAGRQTLQEFAEEWWRLYAAPNLAPTTLASYASLWDAHVLPRLGATRLREIDPQTIARLRADLTSAGVGPSSIRRVMVILQGVLERAVEWQHIRANPARAVRKPPQRRERAVRPLSPATIEHVRARLLERGQTRDAVLVSVLAYAGLRPSEALALDVAPRPRAHDPRRARPRARQAQDDQDRPNPDGAPTHAARRRSRRVAPRLRPTTRRRARLPRPSRRRLERRRLALLAPPGLRPRGASQPGSARRCGPTTCGIHSSRS